MIETYIYIYIAIDICGDFDYAAQAGGVRKFRRFKTLRHDELLSLRLDLPPLQRDY